MTVRIGDLALAAGVITPQRLHEAGASLAAQDRNEAGLEAARRAACLAPSWDVALARLGRQLRAASCVASTRPWRES